MEPLSEPDGFRAELEAAGFGDVTIHNVVHVEEAPSIDDVWASLKRTMAPLAMLQKRMGPAFEPVAAHIHARLRGEFGEGQVRIEMPANLGVGTAT